MDDKDHHKAMKSNALTCIYLMPTNCTLIVTVVLKYFAV